MCNPVNAKKFPADSKRRLENEVIRYAISESSLGLLLVAKSERGVCCVMLGDDPATLFDQLQKRFPRAVLTESDGDTKSIAVGIVRVIESPGGEQRLPPLDMGGTPFQQKVWRALLDIPTGTTTTYAEIAKRIGASNAIRAVGTACGANRIAVIVPCHRVVASAGGLSGYRWGVERKRALLEREASNQQGRSNFPIGTAEKATV